MEGGTTIVTCIEAGPLEAQVLLLVESLRAFGGQWNNTAFIAVKPRRGPGISSHTKRALRRLDVEFVDGRFNVELDWWNNANKSAVMRELETRVATPNITWMDGDMIVLNPLDSLEPKSGASFIARAGEGYLGSDGRDVNAPYWHKLCKLVSIDFNNFPVIKSFPERQPIRAYWQTGIYTYATEARLGQLHYEIIRKLLSSNIGSKQAGVYHQDQVSFALAVQMLGLAHSEYDASMNFNLNPRAKRNADILPIQKVKVLHYHDSFFPQALNWAMDYIKRLPQDRIELIRKFVPLSANATFPTRLRRKFLSVVRQRRVSRFKEQAVLY